MCYHSLVNRLNPLTRLAPSNDTSREVLSPIPTRYAGSLGEGLTLSFEGRRLFSRESDERMQNPWALVTRRLLALDSPNAQQLEGLEIQVPVGDRQGDLQVVKPGTAFMVLLSWLVAWKAHRRLAKRDEESSIMDKDDVDTRVLEGSGDKPPPTSLVPKLRNLELALSLTSRSAHPRGVGTLGYESYREELGSGIYLLV
ncbi:hypothetical protein BKA70DRAFT_1578331 [Coprinopsis sp. MPI-PUGE-AT-0042]|nr:hypothetical protein BKA70DRAFT_1578331 [Coprinopsis sp. MPI-PUGE-AT-0042]